jgi:drug/metabolite transporter (DMT)-like permease
MQLNCTRFLVGGILLIPFGLHALKKRGAPLDMAAWKGFAWLGFLGLVVSMMLYQVSILYIPASVVSVLFSCNPVLMLVFAFFILKAAILPPHIAALVLEVIGALVIIDPLHTELDLRGVALVLLSAGTFALYAVLGKKLCARYSGLAVTAFSCLAASAEMLVIIALSHVPFVRDALNAAGLTMFASIPFFGGYSADNILIMLYVCVCVTGGGYACYFMGMERTSPMQSSLVFFFKPILAPIFAMLVLGEAIPWNMWLGIGLILTASFISMLPTLHVMHSVRHLHIHFPHHFRLPHGLHWPHHKK